MATTWQDIINAAATLLARWKRDVDFTSQIVNGPATGPTSTVATDGGTIPTFQKTLNDFGISGFPGRLANPTEGASLVGFLPPGSGAVGTTVQTKLRRWIDAEDYGWPTREAGAAMNDAIAAAVAAGVREVRYSSPHFNQQTPITLQTGIVVKGPGMNPRGLIRVAAGVQLTAQFETPNFETQIVSQPTNPSEGVIYDFGLENVLLDGNCGSAQNTPVTTDGRRGMAFRVYGARPRFRNVGIIRTPGIGWYSKFIAIPAYIDFGNTLSTNSRDGSYFDNIWVNDSQYENFVFQGPSDIAVKDLYGGWPGNSLWSAAYSGKKSLLFPSGCVRRVLVTAGGSGYTQAGVTYSVSTDATTPPTLQPVIVGGAVDHIIVTTPGSHDATTCAVTITGDGAGATATAYLSNYVVGGLIINKGAEFSGIVHCYNNAQGPAIEVRNDDSGPAPRFNADFIMGESSWGGVVIADKTEGVIGRCDTHGNGIYSSPAALPSLMLTSERGVYISNWKERRDSASGNGAHSLLIRGMNNKVSGKVQSFSGYSGDAILIGGTGNVLDVSVANVSGFALATDYDIQCTNIRLTANANQGVWKNYANAAAITSINSNVDIAAYGSVAASIAYSGISNFSYLQWRSIRIADKRSDTGAFNGSSQALFNSTVDLTSTTEQTFTINHNLVITPKADYISQVQVKPNSGATLASIDYAYVSAITSTNVTVKVKLAAAGSGLGTVQVNIS